MPFETLKNPAITELTTRLSEAQLNTTYGAVSELPLNALRYVDPDPAVDATTGLQAWLNDGLAARVTMVLPPRSYKITAPLVMGTGPSALWKIEATGARIVQHTNNVPILHFQKESIQSFFLNGLKLEYNTQQPATNTGAVAILFDSDTDNSFGFYNFEMSNLQFRNGFRGIGIKDGATNRNPIWGARFRGLTSDATQTGALLHLRQTSSGQPNINVEQVYLRGDNSTEELLNFAGVHSLSLSNIEFNKCVYTRQMLIESCDAVEISNIRTEEGFSTHDWTGVWTFSNSRGIIRGIELQTHTFSQTGWGTLIRLVGASTDVTIENATVFDYTNTGGGQVALINADSAKNVEYRGPWKSATLAKFANWDQTGTKVSQNNYQFTGMGVGTKVISGAGKITVTDADFPNTPPNGMVVLVIDTTTGQGRIACRFNNVWSVTSALS